MPFTITSAAFGDGESIPNEFTCDGANVPPPLSWRDAPHGTRSFALVVDDPDAPGGTFTHWLLYDVPAGTTHMTHAAPGKTLPNDFGRRGYGGPCPPPRHGPHRYVFSLYALDVPALELRGDSRRALDRALHAHTLEVARLTGRYQRQHAQP